MKREGRQHGMVRTVWVLPSPRDPRPNARILDEVDVPATAGLSTKVPSKPTNHSKFTGKCRHPQCSGCHLLPAWKSQDKTKNNNKIKSFDAASHRMVTWRVVDDGPGFSMSGISATGLLDHLVDYRTDEDNDREEDSTRRGPGLILGADDDDEDECPVTADPDASKKLDVYEVTFTINHVEEGDWCLVGKR